MLIYSALAIAFADLTETAHAKSDHTPPRYISKWQVPGPRGLKFRKAALCETCKLVKPITSHYDGLLTLGCGHQRRLEIDVHIKEDHFDAQVPPEDLQ